MLPTNIFLLNSCLFCELPANCLKKIWSIFFVGIVYFESYSSLVATCLTFVATRMRTLGVRVAANFVNRWTNPFNQKMIQQCNVCLWRLILGHILIIICRYLNFSSEFIRPWNTGQKWMFIGPFDSTSNNMINYVRILRFHCILALLVGYINLVNCTGFICQNYCI